MSLGLSFLTELHLDTSQAARSSSDHQVTKGNDREVRVPENMQFSRWINKVIGHSLDWIVRPFESIVSRLTRRQFCNINERPRAAMESKVQVVILCEYDNCPPFN